MKKGQTKHWRSGPPSQSPGEEPLRRLYVNQKKSLADIARHYGVTKTAVSRWLKAAGISTRSISEGTSLAQTGKPLTDREKEAHRASLAKARAGRTEESRRKQSEAMKGKPAWNKGIPWSDEHKAKLKEMRQDPEYRQAMADRFKGENSPLWRGGVSADRDPRLIGWRWNELRQQVYERDKWTCQDCGVHCQNKTQSRTKATVRIQCHHIIPRRNGGADELDNLVTMCMSCHMRREWRENRNTEGGTDVGAVHIEEPGAADDRP